jgi:hypothetical protein
MADNMSDQQLFALQQDPTQGPLTLATVAETVLKRQKFRENGVRRDAATTPPPERTVVAEALAGLPGLPASNLDNMDKVTMAGGGIVAFSGETGSTVFRPRRSGESFSDYRQAMFQAELQAQQEKNAEEAAAREAERSFLQQRLAEERGGEIIPSSPFFDRTLLPGVSSTSVAPRATSLVPTPTPRKDLRKGDTDPRIGLEGLTSAKAKAEQAAAKATADKAVTNKGVATDAGLSTLRPPSTGMADILAVANQNATRQRTEEAEAAKIETDALAEKRAEQAAAAEKAKTSYSDREERLKKREEGMEGAKERNLNSAFIDAGLAIMAGESSNALLNIAKGARQGIQGYEARLEKINANKEKLDDDFSRLYELREAKVTAEGDKLREIKQEEARLKAGGIRNLSAISSNLANTEIKAKEAEFERGFELWKAQLQRRTSLDVANIGAAGRSNADKQPDRTKQYLDFLGKNPMLALDPTKAMQEFNKMIFMTEGTMPAGPANTPGFRVLGVKQ